MAITETTEITEIMEIMEIMLRCEVIDEPGRLAELAGEVGRAGGDIQSVEIVGPGRVGTVLDDLVVVGEPETLRDVVGAVGGHPDVRLVHAGPSRGHPGDAVTRLAIGLEALLTGSAQPDRGVATLVGGLLQASRSAIVAPGSPPAERTSASGRERHVLRVAAGPERELLLERDYPFTDDERTRARSLVRLCVLTLRATLPADAAGAAGLDGTVDPQPAGTA